MTTTRRTPAQIAKDELDQANALVDKTTKRILDLEAELAKAKARLARQTRMRDYAAQHPQLTIAGVTGKED